MLAGPTCTMDRSFGFLHVLPWKGFRSQGEREPVKASLGVDEKDLFTWSSDERQNKSEPKNRPPRRGEKKREGQGGCLLRTCKEWETAGGESPAGKTCLSFPIHEGQRQNNGTKNLSHQNTDFPEDG